MSTTNSADPLDTEIKREVQTASEPSGNPSRGGCPTSATA